MKRTMAVLGMLLLMLVLPAQALAEEISATTDQWGAPLGAPAEDEVPVVSGPEDTLIQSVTMGSVNTNITIDQIVTFTGRLESSSPSGNHVHLGGEYWIVIEGTQILDSAIVAASDNSRFGFTGWSYVVSDGMPLVYVLCLYCDDGYAIEDGITLNYNGKSYQGTVIQDYRPHGDNVYIVGFQDFAIWPSHPVPLYRMYNTKTSEHLWTRNKAEYDSCGSGNYRDWKAEGVAWYAPVSSSKPVYRLYNTKSGDHHYTTSMGEKASLLAGGQWRDEGVAFYSATDKDSNTIKAYRVYNGRLKRGQHHYTKSAAERDSLVKNSGWRDEGVGFYGYSSANPTAAQPLNVG